MNMSSSEGSTGSSTVGAIAAALRLDAMAATNLEVLERDACVDVECRVALSCAESNASNQVQLDIANLCLRSPCRSIISM
jgi:hypothetical protein